MLLFGRSKWCGYELGPYSPSILKNGLSLVLQIVMYLEAFECNTTSDWFSQSEVVLHSNSQNLEKKNTGPELPGHRRIQSTIRLHVDILAESTLLYWRKKAYVYDLERQNKIIRREGCF